MTASILLSLLLTQAPPAQSPVAPQVSSSAPASLDRTRLAVMSLSAAGVPPEYAEGVTETIATKAHQTGVFETISPRQIKSLLAYEKRKELLGGCVQERCYVQIAKVVKAPHLVAGTIASVGKKLSLNLVLIDAVEGRAIKRTSQETTDASDLMGLANEALISLLQPLLSKRQGYFRLAVNVPDADITVDGELRKERAGQVMQLAAGPHVVKINKDGFYASKLDVFVRPGRVVAQDIQLVPAKATIEAYESRANTMRYAAWATGILAAGAIVTSGVFYARASDDKAFVDTYSLGLDVFQSNPGMREEAIRRQDSFVTNQAVYLSALGGAVVSAGVALWLWLAGDDPGRYEEFHSLSGIE